jgi:Fe-S cluster assembly iron-binding protein IscA
MHSTPSRFDRRASTYEDSTLQQFLFVPVHQTALQLALQLLPQARRVLDVGCGTGQLLRHARPCYPTAQLVGVDLAGRMVATASAITPTKLGVRYVHGRAECLPFGDEVFEGPEGSKIFVDKKSYLFLRGTMLDYDTSLITKGFVFNNPNAKQTCGCGSSFTC